MTVSQMTNRGPNKQNNNKQSSEDTASRSTLRPLHGSIVVKYSEQIPYEDALPLPKLPAPSPTSEECPDSKSESGKMGD